MIDLKGIFYTKNGQCLECKPVGLVKQIENKQYDRLAILFNMRRDRQSYRFQEIDEKQLPFLSILDFAIIPLKKPHLQKEEEKNQNAGRRTYNLFKKKTNTKVETRLSPEENESITWQKQLLNQEHNINIVNVWRSEDSNVGDYATRPLEMSSDELQQNYYYGANMYGTGVPLIIKRGFLEML